MFKPKIISIVLIVLLLVTNVGIFAQDIDNVDINEQLILSFEEIDKENNFVVKNELLEIKKNMLKSSSELRKAGFNNEEVEAIKNFSILDILDKYSQTDLYEMGYSENEIRLLEQYKDTEYMNIPDHVLARVGASVRVSLLKLNHYIGGGITTASVRANWAWDKAPLIPVKDGLGFEWGGDFSTDVDDSYAIVEWINRDGGLIHRADYGVDKHSANQGCGFSWYQGSHSGITQGVAVVYISNHNTEVRDFEVTVDYLHPTAAISWSFSWPLGIAVSNTKFLKIMDSDYVRFLKY